ncbi:F-type H+-transporting ATPase subunit b [Dethiosulfatibacter aminovorans DSM 17477]|uniref:ATP synthase subunit b n=1 Tax=Dethiosulfatibacter aminovorans DSM 17477 TaxID=1121476 RepID=A0A1M6LTC6_9FIRM|nr:F0F1 ATP synthase subunit B [Dethiosulfatibacter aminovorans]SHJ74453.1 F-type H+-transporting ATPase subunit b [Dethiosulfatibacter aminovorans DSM 17477]
MLKAGLVELNWTFVFQILNTFILYLLLKKFLFAPVTEVIEAREKSISDSLNDAERISNEAEKYKVEYYGKLQSAEEEGREIIAKATRNADEKSNNMIKEAREMVARQKEKAEADIEVEKKKAINEIKDEISSLAILAASKVLENEVDEDTNKTIVNKFIEQVGDAKWQN